MSNIEAKYTVDAQQHLVLAMLQSLCGKDPEHPGDYINSVYFDTATLRLLDQKVDSEYHKNKVRLRWYGLPDADDPDVTAYLEIKQKQGVQRRKNRRSFDIPAQLIQPGREVFGELDFLTRHVAELGWTPPDALFPMIVIRYHRHRFTDPVTGARISLDTDIRYTRVNPVFFPDKEPRTLRHSVLEIKNPSGEFPASLMALRSRVNTRDSFSKYEECWQMYSSIAYRRDLTSSRYD